MVRTVGVVGARLPPLFTSSASSAWAALTGPNASVAATTYVRGLSQAGSKEATRASISAVWPPVK